MNRTLPDSLYCELTLAASPASRPCEDGRARSPLSGQRDF
jgi:hypothetical protein